MVVNLDAKAYITQLIAIGGKRGGGGLPTEEEIRKTPIF